jgi:TolB protein
MDGKTQIILLSDSQQGYWGPAWSPDGSQLVFSVTTQGNSQLFLSNSDGSGLVQLTNNERSNYLPAWSSNGDVISFISQTGDNTDTAEIYTVNIDGTNELQLTNNNAWEYGTSWSPDGKKIVFGSNRTGDWQIYIMDPD